MVSGTPFLEVVVWFLLLFAGCYFVLWTIFMISDRTIGTDFTQPFPFLQHRGEPRRQR